MSFLKLSRFFSDFKNRSRPCQESKLWGITVVEASFLKQSRPRSRFKSRSRSCQIETTRFNIRWFNKSSLCHLIIQETSFINWKISVFILIYLSTKLTKTFFFFLIFKSRQLPSPFCFPLRPDRFFRTRIDGDRSLSKSRCRGQHERAKKSSGESELKKCLQRRKVLLTKTQNNKRRKERRQ